MKNFNYKKSLGQNFLKDENIINEIVNSISPNKCDLIIEIGPGAGALTKKLVNKGCNVLSFEIDKRLQPILEKIDADNLNIVYEDFLKVNLDKYIKKYDNIYCIGNLPYYITNAIINKITTILEIKEFVIMIQKEVADRILASTNTKQYNSLSVFLQYNYDIVRICNVNKNCFIPIPKVDSTVLKFIRNKKNKSKDEEKFYRLVKDSFKQKRKTLKNNLKNYNILKIEEILQKYNKNINFRAEQISIEEFIDISNNI